MRESGDSLSVAIAMNVGSIHSYCTDKPEGLGGCGLRVPAQHITCRRILSRRILFELQNHARG
jgi:hypothetical protein